MSICILHIITDIWLCPIIYAEIYINYSFGVDKFRELVSDTTNSKFKEIMSDFISAVTYILNKFDSQLIVDIAMIVVKIILFRSK